MMEYIDVNKDELPEGFDIELGNETFTLEFFYNETGDFFTVNIYKADSQGDEPLVLGEKLVLNQPLWADAIHSDLPGPTLVPKDLSGTENRISWENFGLTVFLYIDNEAEEDE